jgi:hypothetical protein
LESDHGVVGEDRIEHQAQVEEVAMDVLDDEREAGLSHIALVRFRHRARRWREPERAVVGLAVVVAGEPEAERNGQDDHG